MSSQWATFRGQQVLAVSGVFTSLATILAALRLYTRSCIVKQMGADDWIIIAAVVFTWAFFGLFVGEVDYGMGEHGYKLPPQVITMQMKCFWATIPIYNTALIISKLSILLQYLRVFTTKRMRIVCYCMIAFISVYGTWTIISAWCNCIPVEKFWDSSVEGFCLSKKGLWFSNSAIHIFTDVMIIIYPMPALKSLKLPKKQKIAVMGIFSLGGFVLITTILRLHSLMIISNSNDPTYDNVGAACWSAIECNVAIICACLPGTRAFITKMFPRFFSSYHNYHYYPYPSRQAGTSIPLSRTGNGTHLQTTVGAGDRDRDDAKFGHHAAVNGNEVTRSGSGSKDEGGNGIQVTTAIYAREDSASHIDDDGSSVRHLV